MPVPARHTIEARATMDWAEEKAREVVDAMLEYVRLRAATGAKGKADYGVAHTFIAQALREAEARGAEGRAQREQQPSLSRQISERADPVQPLSNEVHDPL